MDIHTAYKVIGLTENCSMEELSERYLILTETKATTAQLDDIQTAYNVIKKHIEDTNPEPKESFGKKVGNFFFHYKVHLLVGMIACILVGSLLYSIIGAQIDKRIEAKRPPADIDIMLYGNYHQEDISPIKDRIQALFPEWERIEIQLEYAPGGSTDSQMDMVAMQKSQIVLATVRPDIFIFDLHYFDAFRESELYVPLDQFKDEANAVDRLLNYQREDDDREHVYGIDFTNHELFKDMPIAEDEKIFIIKTGAKQEENALKLLSEMLK